MNRRAAAFLLASAAMFVLSRGTAGPRVAAPKLVGLFRWPGSRANKPRKGRGPIVPSMDILHEYSQSAQTMMQRLCLYVLARADQISWRQRYDGGKLWLVTV